MPIPSSLQYRFATALSDLNDLEEEIKNKLVDYPEDGKVSAIFAHNCISLAKEVIAEYLKTI